MHEPAHPSRRIAPSVTLRGLGALALFCVATGELLRAASARMPQDSVRLLARAAGPFRVAQARITGGFAYAPCATTREGDHLIRGLVCVNPERAMARTGWALRRTGERLRREAGPGNEGGQHASGVWSMLWDQPSDAAETLRAAAARDPRDAGLQNDLAVALSLRAEREDDPSSLVDAYAAADSAVRIDPRMPEGWFTLAVLLERLQLRADATTVWRHYLSLDPASPWAAEARARLPGLADVPDAWPVEAARLGAAIAASDARTVRAIVTAFPSRARAFASDTLVAWGVAAVGDDPGRAAQLLDAARAVATSLAAVTGDWMWQEAVRAIDDASPPGAPRWRALAAGHALLARGMALLDSQEFAGAEVQLREALEVLGPAGSPAAPFARLQLASAQFSRNRLDSALRNLEAVRRTSPRQYLVVRSLAAQMAGLIHDIRADYVHVVASYDSATVEGRTTGEPDITLRVGAWLAQRTAILRGREAGWRVLYGALVATRQFPGRYRSLQSVYSGAALATASDAPRLSVRYGEEAVRLARNLGNPSFAAAAWTRRAEQLAQIGDFGPANAAVDSAFTAAARVGQPEARAQLLSDAALVRGLLALREAPATSEGVLQSVVDEYRATGYARGLGPAILLLAQARVRAGRLDAGSEAFDSAMAVTERERSSVGDLDERVAFLDHTRAVLDQIVSFRARRSDVRGAFDLVERTRARVLLEQLAQRRARAPVPSRVDELQRRLGVDQVVLAYTVLPDETLLWIVRRDRLELRNVAVGQSDLESLVTRFRQLTGDRGAGVEVLTLLERLHQLLIAPAGGLAPGSRLTIIPDRWLHFVPFAALRDRTTGRYVVEDHEVTYAPSATLLLEALSHPAPRGWRPTRVLAIGDPAFNRDAFHLPPLPASAREAKAIGAVYGRGTVLVGASATDAALDAAVHDAEVVHFAGHAVVRPDAPRMSHLVLASAGPSDGAVFSGEISQWGLSRTRLVVLSACTTSGGRLSVTEGPSSLARAFFAAGVPLVVASLWAIEDEGAADFFSAFHARVAQGEAPAAALRATQLDAIARRGADPLPVSAWGAFVLFTG